MIYVDDHKQKARVGRLEAVWSHLFAWPPDDLELVRFAARIGLRSAWLQKPGTSRAHFDVVQSKRKAALMAGAKPITVRDAAKLRQGARIDQDSRPAPLPADRSDLAG